MRRASWAVPLVALLCVPMPASAAKCPLSDDLPVPDQAMWSNFRARCSGPNVRGCLKLEWSSEEYEQNGHKFKVRLLKNNCDHEVILLGSGCTNGNISGYFIRTLEQAGSMAVSSFDPATAENHYAFRSWACRPKSSSGNNCSFADKSC